VKRARDVFFLDFSASVTRSCFQKKCTYPLCFSLGNDGPFRSVGEGCTWELDLWRQPREFQRAGCSRRRAGGSSNEYVYGTHVGKIRV
jgi:hypothetical protein